MQKKINDQSNNIAILTQSHINRTTDTLFDKTYSWIQNKPRPTLTHLTKILQSNSKSTCHNLPKSQ